jgi:DNA-binding IclR family transcriptional regulator
MPQENEGKRINACERTLSIIDTLTELNGATVTEIAEATELPKSTVHYHLKTLRHLEYVVNEEGEYMPSLKFLTIGHRRVRGMDFYATAKPEVDKLAEETGEMCILMREEYGFGFYIYANSGENGVNFDALGSRKYLHNNALGKAILAYLPQEHVSRIIDRHGLPAHTKNTVTEEELLMEQLAEIRDRGVAFDREEQLDGLCCVAAPIKRYADSEQQDILGSISIAGPVSRLQGDYFEDRLANLVSDAANIIELNIQEY